jgi:hypothetical protein
MLTEFRASALSSLVLKKINTLSVIRLNNGKFNILENHFVVHPYNEIVCLNICVCASVSVAAKTSKNDRGLQIWKQL